MAVINGTSGNDVLVGTDDDPFTGTGGDDVITALAGNDVIRPGSGKDTVDAGAGDDLIQVTTAATGHTETSRFDGGDGVDTVDYTDYAAGVTVGAVLDYSDPRYYRYTATLNVTLTTTASDEIVNVERIIGSAVGDKFNFTTDGMGSPLYLNSLELFGGAGSDRFRIQSVGVIVAHGGDGNDSIDSSFSMYGDAGDDQLSAPSLHAGSQVDGGAGNDTLTLSQTSTVDLAAHTIVENTGSVSSVTGVENIVLNGGGAAYGDDGANVMSSTNGYYGGVSLYGRGGDDTLTGSTTLGVDMLDGGAGNDRLDGGTSGNDRLIGGTGSDTAILHFALSDAQLSYGPGYLDLSSKVTGQIQRISGVETYSFNGQEVKTDDGSPQVDDLYYFVHNPDVAATGMDADDHYAQFGWKEGRDPNAWFSTKGYLAANPDVASGSINPLAHYLSNGAAEGRDPSALFDNEQYLANNKDVAAAGINPLVHYLLSGQQEGRAIYAAVGKNLVTDFDPEYYKLANPDVASSGMDPLAHYLAYGWKEGRNPDAYFDTKYYLAQNPDVAASGANPLLHYEQFGWKEGRDPSAVFDTSAYLHDNPDVAASGTDPLLHYLDFGRLEDRTIHHSGFDGFA
jgi:Ca2+-binding RTX toxin-like protein